MIDYYYMIEIIVCNHYYRYTLVVCNLKDFLWLANLAMVLLSLVRIKTSILLIH